MSSEKPPIDAEPDAELHYESDIAFASAMPPLMVLATALNLSTDRIVELLTMVMGSVGILKLLKGSQAYHEGKPADGAKGIGTGNALMFSTAAVGETIRQGYPGVYSFAELPFLLAALKELSKHYTFFQRLEPVMEQYGPKTALVVNLLIHGGLAATGQMNSLSHVLNAIGFTGLSTSFVMDTREEVQNLRRILTVTSTTLLTIGSGMQGLPSIGPFLQSGDIKDLAVVPLIWTALNAIFLVGEAKILLQRLLTNERIEKLLDGVVSLTYPYDVDDPKAPTSYVSPFEVML